jgi:hypothetical protein
MAWYRVAVAGLSVKPAIEDHFKRTCLGSTAQDAPFHLVMTMAPNNSFYKQHLTQIDFHGHLGSQRLNAEEILYAVHCPTAVSAGLHPKYTATFKLYHTLKVINPITSILYVLNILNQRSGLI